MDYVTHLDRADPSLAVTPRLPGLKFFDPVKYWDFHVYYDDTNKAESTRLRQQLLDTFPEYAVDGSILVKKLPNDNAIGPHYFPFWEVDVARADVFAKVLSWFSLHHGLLSVLVHPQTGNDLKDHTIHDLWLGKKLALKLEVFPSESRGIPEFGVKGGAHIPPAEFDDWKTKPEDVT